MPPLIKTQKSKFKPGKNFYLSLLDNCTEAIIVIEETGHLIYQNLAAKTISGHEWKDIEGMHVFDFIHPEDQEEAKAFFQAPGTEPGGQKKKEFRIRHQDKLYRWVEGTFTNMRHHEDIKGFIVTCRDITDKRQIEEDADALVKELQQSFAETSDYKYALDASSVITIVDVSGKIKYVNDNFCTLTQFTREDVIGRNPRIFNSGYHSKEFFKELWETVLAGKVWKGEIRNRKKNGEFYWGNTTIVPFLKSDGKPYQFLVIRNDVTEKKNAEQKLEAVNLELKSMFNKVQDVLFSRDVTKNKIIQISPSCEKVYGYCPEEFYNNGNIWQEVIHPEDKNVINKRFSNFVRGLEAHDEYRIIHKDGSVRWLRSSAVPTLNENKVLVRIDGVITDITERKNAESAHRKSEANLNSIVQNTDSGYVLLDKDFNIITFNYVAKKWDKEFFHFNLQEGANYLKLPPESLRTEYHAMSQSLLSGNTIEHERCWQKPDGTWFWYYARTHSIIDEKGLISGFVISLSDTTKRKEDEQKIETANKELNRLFNSIQEVLYSVDITQNKVTQISSACEKIYGYKPEDFYNDVDLWHKAVHPDDLHLVTGHIAALSKGIHVQNQYRIIHKDGSIRWIRVNIIPTLEDKILVRLDGVTVDITEKKKAEELLGQQMQLLHEFFESASEVILVRDVDTGKFIDCNSNAIEMFGYSKDELFKLKPWELSPAHQPDGRSSIEAINEVIERALRGEKVITEWAHKTASGKILCNELRLTKLNIPGRNITRSSIISIAEKKRAEQALRKSEANLRSIVDNTDTSYVILDKDFKIVTYNALAKKWASELLKINFEEGANYFELAPEAHRSVYEKMFQPAMAGGKFDEEICRDKESESPYWFHVRIHGIKDQSGTFYGIFIAVTNITTRKEAEQKVAENEKKISSLFENMQEGIANCEMIYEGDKPVDFIYHHVNDRFEVLTGLKNVTGKRVTEAIPGIANTDQEIFNTYNRVIKTGKSIKTEYFITALNMWFSLSIYHIEGNYFAVVFDVIDERKKAEAEILALNESLERKVLERTAELEQTNKDLEAFSYTVSHDLQAPLRAVRGFSNILREQYSAKLDDAGKEYLTFVSDGAARMSLLITELLAFSRFGKVPLMKHEVNMDAIVNVVIEEAKASDPDYKTQIKTGEIPAAFCDPGLIKQVWSNLIYNAIKYSKKKPLPVVEIGSDIVDGKVIYFVKDNGAGFDMKNAVRLFNVFKRLHSDAEFEGTGVGLALVHKIVTRHGGLVWAEAKVNEGATFYFTLPDK